MEVAPGGGPNGGGRAVSAGMPGYEGIRTINSAIFARSSTTGIETASTQTTEVLVCRQQAPVRPRLTG